MDLNSKSKLTGGTLFATALIVPIFGNARSVEIVEKLDKTHSAVVNNTYEIRRLEKKIEELKQSNIQLKNQLDEDKPI